jgi:Na+/H+ antiporter NhaC
MMTYPLVLAMVVLVAGAIVGMESLVRLVRDLLHAGGWQALIGIVIIVVGAWSLDRLLRELVGVLRRSGSAAKRGGDPSAR